MQPSTLFIINRILCGPLEILFTLLVFILSKNLGADPFQLTLIACIKPISSFFAFYASSVIFDRPQRIRYYILANNLIGCLPCLMYPFFESVWFYIGSYTLFMTTLRAVYPGWVEILKSSMEASALSKIISLGTSVSYFMSILLPPLICFGMDKEANLWRYLFMFFALFNMMSLPLLMFIKAEPKVRAEKSIEGLLAKGWNLLKENRSFAHYQILFFLGGAGIIGSQSILPFYFKDSLNLSYTQLGLAFSLCKGLSFVIASPCWAKYANRISLYHLNAIVNLFTTLFFAFIMAASSNANWLFLAYFFYGAMQAGCEMSWNLSGPFFAGPRESTLYSSLNLACVGIRGCICPFLGYLFFIHVGALPIFIVSAVISLIGTAYGLWIGNRYSGEIRPSQSARFFRSKALSAIDPFSAQGTVPSELMMAASSNSK